MTTPHPDVTIRILRAGLNATRDLLDHQLGVLGGWVDCPPCTAASEQCDGSLVCEQARDLRASSDRADRLADPDRI